MEYLYYYIFFPDGERQQIFHQLAIGDIVDINGKLYLSNNLSPFKIAYKVMGVKKQTKFKETWILYKLDLLSRDEVVDEIDFNEEVTVKKEFDYDKIFNDLEKKLKKRR
jgi:hypothetical protein